MENAALAPPRYPGRRSARRSAPRSRRLHSLRESVARLRLLAPLLALAALAAVAVGLQPLIFHALSQSMSFEMAPGQSPALYPRGGPADRRKGYDQLGKRIERAQAAGFRVEAQARQSAPLRAALRLGLSPPYAEKPQAGLRILARDGTPLFAARFPEQVFESFGEIPPLVVDTLVFVENRDLFDGDRARSNPAIEWDRLGRAAIAYPIHRLQPGHRPFGGSTLATQLEKFQHSPGGLTDSPSEKLRQLVSASLRVYRASRETRLVRTEIVRDYLNAVPLAALPGRGEVHGIRDGLRYWFGADPDRVLALLTETEGDAAKQAARAQAYRQVLTLILAAQRPSHYLRDDPSDLDRRVDSYLELLAGEGVLAPELAAAAARAPLDLAPVAEPPETLLSKVHAPVRTPLLAMLEARDHYELDRLDLVVESTLDAPAQRATTAFLCGLREPGGEALGPSPVRDLVRGEAGRVEYALTLYERVDGAALLRIQTDSLAGPFDAVEGARLDLGSTAKLRTLVSYLETVAGLHASLANRPPAELGALALDPADRLARWAVARLAAAPELSLEDMLEEALDRRYSASPAEGFFTGGGLHRFHNFDRLDDERVLSVREAFRRSVNLVFVRLMRDLVAHHAAAAIGSPTAVLSDARHPLRRTFLERFAERESAEFVARFWGTHRSRDPGASLELLLGRRRWREAPLAAVLRYLEPEAPFDAFYAQMRARIDGLPEAQARTLYERYAPGALSLGDRAYVTGVHPLELWVAAYLRARPEASRAQVIAASAEARRESYAWLFRTRRKHAADRAIRSEIEREAFATIHAEWRRQGYPFASMVPSLATAIGSSGDRPAALAELVGIVLADGVREPRARIERLHLAEGTPYEVVLAPEAAQPEPVLRPEVARAVRRMLVESVESGTGRRAHQAIRGPDGSFLEIGGKTGTGDHRHHRWGARGQHLGSEARARTATFAFFLGDRFFGVATAYVSGPEAGRYEFTSALAVELVRSLAPVLEPLVARENAPGGSLPAQGA